MRRPFAFASRFFPLVLAAALGGSTAACKPALIPGTAVEDTDENREVIELLAKYRKAVVERDIDAIVALCAADYFEDNGTAEQADDYGIDALRTRLREDFAKTKDLQLEILVQQIFHPEDLEELEGREAPSDQIKVAYRYSTRALVAFPAGEKWISVSDVNQLVLRKDPAAGFLIVSGL